MAGKEQEKEYVANLPFGYAHLDLDRGQIFKLMDRPNDKRLVGRKYMRELEKGEERYACSECGAEFASEPLRRAHGDKRHPRRILTPEEEDLRADREDRFLTQNNPLNLSA